MDLWVNQFKEKVKNKKQIYNNSPSPHDEEVWQYLKDLQTIYCIVLIDKVSNNFCFICKKIYVSKLLEEIGWSGIQSDTFKLVNKLKEEVIDDNITLSSKLNLEHQNDFKTLPIMYWFPDWSKFYCYI